MGMNKTDYITVKLDKAKIGAFDTTGATVLTTEINLNSLTSSDKIHITALVRIKTHPTGDGLNISVGVDDGATKSYTLATGEPGVEGSLKFYECFIADGFQNSNTTTPTTTAITTASISKAFVTLKWDSVTANVATLLTFKVAILTAG